MKNWVKRDNSIKNLDKLVIIIDNMDRWTDDVVYNLLTDIKTFLSLEPLNIIFIIPIDDESLIKHIFSKNNKDNPYKEKKRIFT